MRAVGSKDSVGCQPLTGESSFGLQPFIDRLEKAGELDIRDDPVLLGDVAAELDGNPKAVLFRQVCEEGIPLVGNVAATRKRLAMAFGTTVPDVLGEVLRRLSKPPVVRQVTSDQAPVQQVVLRGEEADLTKLPVHLQHDMDGSLYISAAIDIVQDSRNGLTNVGIRRLMLRGRREAGVDLIAPSDLKDIYQHECAQGRTLPIAFVVGSHPVDHVAATMRMPVNEMDLLAKLRDEPLPLVKCVTNDLLVPADAQYILEGYLGAEGHTEPEGPYGEFLGYYGGVKKNPVFHLTAITHRREPIFQTMSIAGRQLALTDTAQLIGLRTEVSIWRALETAIREPLGVYATTSSGGMFNVRISMRQRAPGEARNAIAAAFGSLANVKHVFIFDPDIDIFSDAQADWAFATRFQADRDLVVSAGHRALPLDPSLSGAHTGAKAGFDCTMPIEVAKSLESRIPGPPAFEGDRFESIEAAMLDGPKSFGALMTAVGTRDGRKILHAFDDLRAQGRLDRTADGAWTLK